MSSKLEKLTQEFKKQAKVTSTPDGKTIEIAGYTAVRDETSSTFGLFYDWNLYAPRKTVPVGHPQPPASQIIVEGGCHSQRHAINILACAAAKSSLLKSQ